MSFHGGLAGTTLAMILFARRHAIPIWSLFDVVAAVVPIGLFFGRIANFVNGELWGRVTDAPWGMVFCNRFIIQMTGGCPAGPIPRHPSQLYEAFLEGAVLFVILQVALRVFRAHERPGLIAAMFFLGYGTFRFFCEFFREPDTQFIGPISMGMALSIPVWLGAAALFWAAYRKPRAA